jgi:hypothetical protein
MGVTVEVPSHQGSTDKVGQYGGYQVLLQDCACGGVYADADQHSQTAWHKAWQAATAKPAPAA